MLHWTDIYKPSVPLQSAGLRSGNIETFSSFPFILLLCSWTSTTRMSLIGADRPELLPSDFLWHNSLQQRGRTVNVHEQHTRAHTCTRSNLALGLEVWGLTGNHRLLLNRQAVKYVAVWLQWRDNLVIWRLLGSDGFQFTHSPRIPSDTCTTTSSRKPCPCFYLLCYFFY